MATMLKDLMTTDPVVLPMDASITEAAREMAKRDIGDVLVHDSDGKVCGIVTDRDVTVKIIAENKDPEASTVGEICGQGDIRTLAPDASIGDAVRLMTEEDIRRIPIVEDGKAVGVISLGDLAINEDGRSALADISSAPPNN